MAGSLESLPQSITIRSFPFDSREAALLVTALDEELALMYPDWASLPHPGENLGLLHPKEHHNPHPDRPTHYEHNTVDVNFHSSTSTPLASDQSLTPVPPSPSVLDIERPNANPMPESGSSTGKQTAPFNRAPASELAFFIAFDTKTDHLSAGLTSNMTESTQQARNYEGNSIPIGCVALRPLPHFPYHYGPEAYEPQLRSHLMEDIAAEVTSGIKTAELKRCYVAPAYRRSSRETPSETNGTSKPKTLADVLLQTAETHARTHMGVSRLVLETGIRQFGAIKLYERNGWTRRAEFGDYVSAGTAVGGMSLCYEKMI